MFPRVTHPSATSPEGPVRLACVRPAASVHSEPGSNSQVESSEELSLTSNLRTSAYTRNEYRSLTIHVLVFPKKQEPTNREALNSIIGTSSYDNFPKSPDMLRLDADAPKPSAYPFNHSIFKERGHKTNSTPELRAHLPSHIQISLRAFQLASRFRRSASLRLVVFGEALSRVSRQKPQEEKCRTMSFSCHAQCLQGFFTAAA